MEVRLSVIVLLYNLKISRKNADWQLRGFSAWSPKEGYLFVCSPKITLVSLHLCENKDEIAIHEDLKGSANIKAHQI